MAKVPNWPLILAAGFTLLELLGWLAGIIPGRAGLPAFVTLFLVTWLILWIVRAGWRLYWRLTRKPAGGKPTG